MKRLGCRETTFFFCCIGGFSRRSAPNNPQAIADILCKRKKKRFACLSKLRQTNRFSFAEEGGFEPPVQLPVRQFSKLLVSATHPPFLDYN